MQFEIIGNVLAGRDSLVLMPTGGGKSLCYQLPALCLRGLTLVISPLIALMKDQVDALQTNGIAAAFINSSVPPHEVSGIYAAARAGRLKLLYIAPERLAVPGFEEFLRGLGVAQIAIDEAHCISEWGHDFRPDYRNLRSLRAMFPRAPVMALTATATAKVRDDIAEQLMIPEARRFIASFNRENLTYIVRPKRRPFDHLVQQLRRHSDGASIVYCLSRDGTERLASKLSQHGLPALPYHAGLDPSLRRDTQERFIRDEARIIVATIAFGMGIDKPDVRLIAHYDLPKTLEGYYQETGRAGRDGLPSECVLYFSAGDRARFTRFIDEIEDPSERERAHQKLDQMIAFGEARTCRRAFVLRYFGETYDKTDCGGCDVCLAEREAFDATEIAQMVLSAVIRTGERFGSAHVIKVLRGSRAKKVLEWRHHELPVYGIARRYDRDELKEIVGLLEDEGLLQRSPDKFATVSVTPAGHDFLRWRKTLSLSRIRCDAQDLSEQAKLQQRARGQGNGRADFDSQLFERLRELRLRLAEAREHPAFMIFSNRTLQEMARAMPRDHAGFADIPGVGPAKLEEFADDFLQVIREYTAPRDAE